jgi:hypothetical protein
MLRTLLLTAFLLSLNSIAHAQRWDWYRTCNTPMTFPCEVNAYAGEVYVLYAVPDSITLDNITYISPVRQSSCIARYDTAGNLRSAWIIPGLALHFDVSGTTVCVTGLLMDTVQWGNQQLNAPSTGLSFVAKLDTAGNLAWVKTLIAPKSFQSTDVAIAPNGNVLVASMYSGPMLFAGDTLEYSGDDWNGALLAFSASGQETDYALAHGPTAEFFTGIVFDPAGNIGVTGVYGYSCDTMTTSYTSWVDTAAITNDEYLFMPGFLAYFNAALEFKWVKKIATSDISFDSRGNLYSGGYILTSTITLDDTLMLQNPQYNTDQCLLVKYSPAGERLWYRFYGTAAEEIISAISVTPDDDVIVLGRFTDSLTFPGEPVMYGAFGSYIGCFDSTGHCEWMNISYEANSESPTFLSCGNADDSYVLASTGSPFTLQPGMDVPVSNGHVVMLARLKHSSLAATLPPDPPADPTGKPLLFPNPVGSDLNVLSNGWGDVALVLTVYDANGKICLVKELPPAASHTVSLEFLSDGFYHAELRKENGQSCSFPLIRMR